MKRIIVNSDHDRTLNSKFTTSIAIPFNHSLDPKKLLTKLMNEPILIAGKPTEKQETLLPREVVEGYLSAKGKKELETADDIAKCGEWGMYEDGRVSKESLIRIKAELLVGLTESDLKNAVDAAGETLTKGAIEYAKGIAGSGFVHVIISDGWAPIVEGTANALRDNGADITVVRANAPVFENGVFTGKLEKIDKWPAAFAVYGQYGFMKNGNGVYTSAVVVDDSAANMGGMKQHGLSIAFCPTDKDLPIFRKEPFGHPAVSRLIIQTKRDLQKTFGLILDFANQMPY